MPFVCPCMSRRWTRSGRIRSGCVWPESGGSVGGVVNRLISGGEDGDERVVRIGAGGVFLLGLAARCSVVVVDLGGKGEPC